MYKYIYIYVPDLCISYEYPMYTLYICNTYDLNPKYLPQLSARPAMGSTMVSIKPLAPRRERFMSSTPMPLGTDVVFVAWDGDVSVPPMSGKRTMGLAWFIGI